jgi:hypothetical protein
MKQQIISSLPRLRTFDLTYEYGGLTNIIHIHGAGMVQMQALRSKADVFEPYPDKIYE